MSLFDQAVRYTAKHFDAVGFLRFLFPGAFEIWEFTGWLDARRLPFPGEPDRICDTVALFTARAKDRPPTAVVIEFEGDPSRQMLPRLGSYSLDIQQEEPAHVDPIERYHVVAAVIYLSGPPQDAEWEMRPEGFDGIGLSIGVRSVSMREESAEELLRGIAEGRISRCMLPWVPLMQGGDTEAVAQEWKRLAETEPIASNRADYGGLARVLAAAANRAAFWNKQLEGWQVTESPVILEWVEKGHQAGLQEGRQEGVQAMRRSILALLESRFGDPLPADVRSTIEAQSELSQLTDWFQHALAAESLESFQTSIT